MNNKANPFQIKTPEKLNPEETVRLFVDVFTDYQKIKTEGHTFLLGPRGIGKSMMFRFIQPDCQCVSVKGNVSDIDFIGSYIPLRNASFTTITELRRLTKNASQILNEHIMSVYVLQMLYKTLSNEFLYNDGADKWNEEAKSYYTYVCDEYFDSDDTNIEGLCIYEIFKVLTSKMEIYYRKAINYTKKLAFTQEIYPYNGPLFDYLDVVIPVVSRLQIISCFNEKKVFFLIDDAHCLTDLQTHILNYWVSTRTSGFISLKISTQYNYKNYYTITGATIDSPHDYSEIDMFRVYTSQVKDKYAKRMTEIVERRLKNVGINQTAEAFFPFDVEQEKKIDEIAKAYRERFDKGEGKGNRRSDDAVRYARPDYIKSLSGKSKSSPSYSYAGFSQLIHLSSGIARLFLESAYRMYAEESANNDGNVIAIPPNTQNIVIREDANQYLFKELPKYAKKPISIEDESGELYPEEDVQKLYNVINGLGGLFREILLSDRSERRVFSIAFSDTPSDEVNRVLRLGVQLGYLHRSTIGKKNGGFGGRTDLYILNRRLAPIWTLDPSSFAGYLFIQSKLIEEAMNNPDKLLRRLRKSIKSDDDDESGFVQLSFFQDGKDGNEYLIEVGEENDL